MKKKTTLLVTSMLLLFTIFPTALVVIVEGSESTTVSIEPEVIWDPNMGPGTRFKVDIVVDYVEKLWAYQVGLGEALFEIQGFNPSVLNLVAVENGPFLGSAGGTVEFYSGEIDNTVGTLSLTVGILDPARRFPTGGGVLATLTFEVVGYGQSPIRFDLDTGLLDSQNEWVARGTIDPQVLKDGIFANVADLEPEPPPEPPPEMPHDVHDVAVSDLRVWPTSTYPGSPIDIDVTIENQGDFQENFDVLIYAARFGDGLHIDVGNEMVSLGVGASDSLFLIWDTTDVPSGSYLVIAEAVLLDDSDPKDNALSGYVGGIYPRPAPKKTNMFNLLGLFGVTVLLVGLGAAPVAFFKVLMSQKLQWPRPLSKRSEHRATE